MESYGLVLAGGGAKGVYQIGAWRALRELDIPIQRVVGTSVGAMNGALVVLDKYQGAVELWKSMSIEKGFQLPEPLRVPDNLFSIKNADIVARELWRHHGLDISPLRRRLEDLVSEGDIRLSPKDYGLVTFEVSGRQSRFLYKDQIPVGQMMDYIMASAAYPGLKRPEIDGKTFLDGGLVDNVPVKMLLQRQKNNIVVVNIGDTELPKDLDPKLNLIYIKPTDSIGKAFEFQPETAESKMEMGWFDTMKGFGRFSGEWLYFRNEEYQRLRDELGDNVLSGLEYAARLYGIDKLRVMNAEEFVREMLDCDRLSGEKFRLFRSRIDLPDLMRALHRGELKDYNLTGDILLQLLQTLVEGEKERPHLRFMVQKMLSEPLRAAEAVLYLRRYAEGK